MKVYLDDIREAPEGWIRTRTFAETISLLETGKVDELSLDHDLKEPHYGGDYGDGETGYDVLLWLCDQVGRGEPLRIPEVIRIHSWNPGGRARMETALRALRGMKKSE